MKVTDILPLAALAFGAAAAIAQDSEKKLSLEEFEKSLQYQTGAIELPGGMAKLNLGPEFRFLPKADSRRLLENAWGNPPDDSVLGMVIPAKLSPLAGGGWGVVITYEEDGFVKDDEAGKINYTEMLAEMKKDTAESNEERKKAGYPSIELVGWAAPPRYDQAAKKLYWAKELKFDGSPDNTLNYNIRALGRRGVLVLNAVAGKSQLAMVEQQIPALLPMVAFNEGHRYADFVPSTDKVATYGIAALVAGKLAAKTGLLKGLIALLIAGKKLIPLALLALVGGAKALWSRWRRKPEETVASTEPPPADAPTA